MITIDHKSNKVSVAIFGEFTLADYKEFENLINYKVRFEGAIDLLLDLRNMAGLTVDVAWEELKFVRRHAHDFRFVAILTEDQWISLEAVVTQFFTDAEVQVFQDENDARTWLDITEESVSNTEEPDQ